MTCPSEVTHSMYADGALSAHEAMLLERHAAVSYTHLTLPTILRV